MTGDVRVARPADMAAVHRLRHEVFCVEQGVPADLERDALDDAARHLVATDAAGTVVGCCRLVPGDGRVRLGRMAVAAPCRGHGVGARLLGLAHEVARADGAREVELHAQLAARDFYARAGYVAEGDVFADAGIDHVVMRRLL